MGVPLDAWKLICLISRTAEVPIGMPGGVGGLLSDGESYPDMSFRFLCLEIKYTPIYAVTTIDQPIMRTDPFNVLFSK